MASTPENRRILERYFESLEAAEFDRAAAQFTEDVTYIHPPLYGDETHLQGRETLLTYFTDVRGRQEHSYQLDRTVSDANAVAAVGHVTGPDSDEPRECFVSYAAIEDERIAYYVGGLVGLSWR